MFKCTKRRGASPVFFLLLRDALLKGCCRYVFWILTWLLATDYWLLFRFSVL
jgi:hypothetical protein